MFNKGYRWRSQSGVAEEIVKISRVIILFET